MRNKSCNYFYLIIILLFVISLLTSVSLSANCNIKVNTYSGCVPQPVFFKAEISGLPNGVTAVSYSWDFKDNSTSQQDSVTHIYYTKGKYNPTVTIKFSDGSTCQATLSKSIHIFDNPKAAFNLPDSVITLCSSGQSHCFKDASTSGLDGAPVSNWVWNFGDGVISQQKDPCHEFLQAGKFLISLEVTDTNGCKNFFQRKITVRFLPPINQPVALFDVKYSVKCGQIEVNAQFKNLTDTAGKKIRRFIWDYGDGSKPDSCNLINKNCLAKWNNFTHRYTKAGIFNPTLYIENVYGCKDSFTFYSIELENYKLDVFISDTQLCYSNSSTVFFEVPYIKQADSIKWDFGDPESKDLNYAFDWNTAHIYSNPGTYTIYIRIVLDSCQMDTVICRKIKIYGPIAKIQLDTAVDRVPKLPLIYKIPKPEFKEYFDTCQPFTKYWKYEKITIPDGDTTYGSYCNADKSYTSTGAIYNCEKKKIPVLKEIFTRKILGIKDRTYMGYEEYYWFPGDPFPDTPVYRVREFIDRPLVWNDTDLYSIRCGPPKLIKFTNFSRKYRGYNAVDDNPPGSPEVCFPNFNPDYPWATDSLDYFWDFFDGDNSTSTQQNPSQRSRFSTEKVPTHLFFDTGCFFVKLKVTDKVTGCVSEDDIKIVLQKADAGWAEEYDSIKNMTYDKQKRLPVGYPRRGLILEGKPCIGCQQTINIDETLPACRTRDYQFVFDSAGMAKYKSCGSVIDSSKVVFDWDKDFEGGTIMYADSGWKTIGFVVYYNAYCTDTVWYHNYKYFHKVEADIALNKHTGCLEDTFKLFLKNPNQYGIKLMTFEYKYIYGKGFDTIPLPTDTLRYKIIKNNWNETDTVTSTTHNPQFDFVDKDSFSFLKDTIKKVLDKPGFVKVKAKIYSRFGCVDSIFSVFSRGHFSNFSVPNRTVCINDTVKFSPQVFYNLLADVDVRPFWSNPQGVRSGRKPAISEKIKWDFDGDGVIDDSTFSPTFIYNKVGNYTVKLYTRDSLGCDWQFFEKKDFIKVIDIKADFTVDSPGFVRFCHPQFFQFRDNSSVIDSSINPAVKEKVALWVWDFGDGSQPVIADSTRKNAGYVYTHNGEYDVTLKAFSSTTTGANSKGCVASVTKRITIEGPQPDFKIVGDTIGCVPFTLKIVDLSKKARFKDWRLGDGTVVSNSAGNGDTILLTYNKPGIFCPRLIAADSIRDFNNNISYCSDTFPYKNCQFQVNVLPQPKVVINYNDTLICEGDFFSFADISDTAFKVWRVNFGDGSEEIFTNKPASRHQYLKKGDYKLRYKGYGNYCPDSLEMKIKVIDILADFYMDTTKLDTPYFWFVNTSHNGVQYRWIFDDGTPIENTKNMEPIRHKFQQKGNLDICLIAENEKQCPDTICKKLTLIADVSVPNVFTPGDKNGYNDRFVIDIRGELKYELEILNRWGQKIFRSENKHNTWDGTEFNNGSSECPAGTYFYIFNYQLIGEESKRKEGTITLIR